MAVSLLSSSVVARACTTTGRRTHLIVSMQRGLIVAVLCVAVLSIAVPAHAYDEVGGTGGPCVGCHGGSVNSPSGPHGGYTATSTKCATCHSAHKAPAGGIVLLPAATVLATCQTCHDGTSGQGVYGVIKARTGVDPADPAASGAAHKMLDSSADPITTIPGGDSTGGGARTAAFSGTAGGLTCSDCHSPHGSNVVAAFTGDRARSTTDTAGLDSPSNFYSTRLLRQRPTSTDAAYASVTEYGSDWCAACHAGRLSWHELYNHPVEAATTYTGPGSAFTYESVARLTGAGASTTTLGSLGRNNFGYVMPDPRTAEQSGHEPICQQCHEDARNVGDVTLRTVDATEVFKITDVDGLPSDPVVNSDNPRFQVFPHESENDAFLIETDNDLCLNCHKQPAG